MSGDPNCIAQRLMKLELQAPPAGKDELAADAAEAKPVNEADKNPDGVGADEAEDDAVDDDSSCDDEDEDADDAAVREPDDLEELAGLLTSESRRDRLLGAKSLRSRVSDRHEAPGYSRLLTSPALAALVSNLESDTDQELQFESAWALTNLLTGSGARPADLVTSSGLGRRLIRMLRSAPTERLREQACWALANVAGESPAWRDQLLHADADSDSGSDGGLLPALISMWESEPGNGLLDASSLLLVNLFRDRRPRLKFEYTRQLLPHVLRLLRHPYDSVVPNLLWALSYAVEGSEPRARLLLRDSETVACLLGFLESKDDSLLIPTMRLLCCAAACVQALPAGLMAFFPTVRRLLGHPDAKLRRQSLLLLGCAASGPDAQLEAAAQAGCLTALGDILTGRRPQVDDADEASQAGICSGSNISELERREAFWILPDFMLSRAHKFSKRIMDECLEGLLASLNLEELEVTRCGLLCLRHLLFAAKYKNRPDLDFDTLKSTIEKFDGLKKIEATQKIDDKEVIKLSDQILNQYFWGNEKKYLEEGSQSQEASPSPVPAAADGEVGDDLLDDGDDGEAPGCGPDKDAALSSLIGGLKGQL